MRNAGHLENRLQLISGSRLVNNKPKLSPTSNEQQQSLLIAVIFRNDHRSNRTFNKTKASRRAAKLIKAHRSTRKKKKEKRNRVRRENKVKEGSHCNQ